MIIWAGIPLDMKIPKELVFPSTSSITEEVSKPYQHHKDDCEINLVENLYQRLMMAERSILGELQVNFLQKDVTKPMYSKNGCLLLHADGFKAAAARKDEIVKFLKSYI